MNKYAIPLCTAVALLLSGPALAGHCDADMIEAQTALNQAYQVEPQVLDAASALLDSATAVCAQEEQLLANAEFDSPMLEPDYVSLGQAILINVTALVGGP
ncbi:hypothetical protein SAMN05216603_102264 [Pseudomonas benzenivorans]|nr:hypothetical protein [Pseudomonas benzenivorans]SDG55163.1 hypothetical protein SAMN05216603_102264 [Pseudomonas benzenivorans]